jgi:hypothetical protein
MRAHLPKGGSCLDLLMSVTFWFCPKSKDLMFDQVYRKDCQHFRHLIDLLRNEYETQIEFKD